MTAPVGYFVWMKSLKGPPSPKKYDPMLQAVLKDTAQWYLQQTLSTTPIPLNAEEWTMSLDELATKYPAPKMPDQQFPKFRI